MDTPETRSPPAELEEPRYPTAVAVVDTDLQTAADDEIAPPLVVETPPLPAPAAGSDTDADADAAVVGVGVAAAGAGAGAGAAAAEHGDAEWRREWNEEGEKRSSAAARGDGSVAAGRGVGAAAADAAPGGVTTAAVAADGDGFADEMLPRSDSRTER
ncbi:hypothetical protein CBR_g29898 [Chara braunii]|uniref:Uncharacterized protein n=1 Tax=Chara braunii TaxID=69332 RepID=A0A388JWX3_CHABU|nr:hypothetical protein CBR_g29898 [Chara braunii]|eukprot:GBG62290.1 hypothetical protein CBR_g29898 [Chara braunii]